ncbi:MAG: hypothetical protein AVDCRST_MAG49-3710 [uncultured Thermomicrobiales bacterium]|uniref:Uncharacterized protein n=1 Tax=uncultured Thermomicrobiales bacterium TaxID=1645740 RepID=A0A6J4VBZ8_9BACT|nr:MAG: hypothetical protein AVDCRST_MAG49-3710 [uncultured Thermomicrobiales bacterium]
MPLVRLRGWARSGPSGVALGLGFRLGRSGRLRPAGPRAGPTRQGRREKHPRDGMVATRV